jgi:glucose uptake protein GlcU
MVSPGGSVAHVPIDASPAPPGTGPSELVPACEVGWRRESQRALLLFLLGTGGLVFALQVALTVMVPLLAAVSLIVSTALLLSGVAWAIWALADMGQTREMRSVALAVATAAFPLVTGALLSLYGALLTLIVIILADG